MPSEKFIHSALKWLVIVAMQGGEVLAHLVVLLVLGRLVGAEVTGSYVFAFDSMSLAMLAALCGLDLSSARFLPTALADGKTRLAHGFVRTGYVVVLVFGLFAAMAMLGLVTALRSKPEPLGWGWWFAALAAPIGAMHLLQSSVLRGLGYDLLARGLRLASPVMLLVAVLAILPVVSSNAMTADTLLATLLVATVIATALSAVSMWRRMPALAGQQPCYERPLWLKSTLLLALVSGVMVVQTRLDTVMMAALRDESSACVYATIVRIGMLLTLAQVAANYMLAPRAARLYASHQHAELQQLVRRTGRLALAAAVPLLVGIIALGPTLLRALGGAYETGYAPLVVLSLGYAGIVATGPVGVIASMTGHERLLAWVQGGCVATNVAMNAALIPRFGLLGAAVATSIATVASRLVLCELIWRATGISAPPFRGYRDRHAGRSIEISKSFRQAA